MSVAFTFASSLPQYAENLPESTTLKDELESQSPRYLVSNSSSEKFAQVHLLPAKNTGRDPVYGTLELQETPYGILIHGKIFGLEPGKHGFHVHAVGDLSNDCKASGGHFNPQMVN